MASKRPDHKVVHFIGKLLMWNIACGLFLFPSELAANQRMNPSHIWWGWFLWHIVNFCKNTWRLCALNGYSLLEINYTLRELKKKKYHRGMRDCTQSEDNSESSHSSKLVAAAASLPCGLWTFISFNYIHFCLNWSHYVPHNTLTLFKILIIALDVYNSPVYRWFFSGSPSWTVLPARVHLAI